jgi:hypothetical protein
MPLPASFLKTPERAPYDLIMLDISQLSAIGITIDYYSDDK